MNAEKIVGSAEVFEGAEALRQCWAEAIDREAEVLIQCWAELFFGAAEDFCGGSRGLENQAIRTGSS